MTNRNDVMHDSARWSAEQVMEWMDSFRALILECAVTDSAGSSAYDRVREADPSRRSVVTSAEAARSAEGP